MRTLSLLSASLFLSLLFAACTCSPDKVSFNTTEQARDQARQNAEQNAIKFRSDNPQFTELNVYARGDSTISPECPQGDGWASMDLRTKEGQVVAELKCSTVSMAIGCLESKDFKSKAYAKEDGKCNADVPFPLPKLTK